MNPITELHPQFSSADAVAVPWAQGREILEQAEIYWLSTVTPTGQPHVTPLIAIWHDGAMYFSTGPAERKAKNLEENPHSVITTGRNSISEGLDVVVEGRALPIHDTALLQRLAALYDSKYGWKFTVRNGAFHHTHGGGKALVFEVRPAKAFGFGRGASSSQTRWSFQ